ncbi:MAG: 30S ribosomal protein S12 methylthiotransferase RimO [Thermoanaerobacterales bacterium]|nr:30S ribosomal protein S12 methylthiotransferase RimO [Thermoanaerobacterales bacterium]
MSYCNKKNIKVGLISLGCDKNLVDSEFMLGVLKKHNYVITNKADEAEIIIVNTCGFIQSAKQESIDTLFQMSKYKKKGNCRYLIAAGSLAQRYKGQLLQGMPELDAVVGTGNFHMINEVIQKLDGARINLTSDRVFIDYDINHRVKIYPNISFVKIADGCSNRCSYCAIPQIKGPYRSRDMESIRKEVELLLADGTKEINLVAQNTSAYGIDIYGKPSLIGLLKQLIKIKGDFWIRLLYTYPTDVDDELLETVVGSPKIANYLDIPMQHVNDRILKLMNRPMNGVLIRRLIEKIRGKFPELTLRSTFIVGFPTETDDEFGELIDFTKIYKIDKLGVFKYSCEEGTRAAGIKPHIPPKIKQQRYQQLMSVQREISLLNNKKLEGKLLRVLAERYNYYDNIYVGRSEKDAPGVDGLVFFKGDKCVPGNLYNVRIKKAKEYDLIGEVEY